MDRDIRWQQRFNNLEKAYFQLKELILGDYYPMIEKLYNKFKGLK